MVTQTFTVKISCYANPRKQHKFHSGYELAGNVLLLFLLSPIQFCFLCSLSANLLRRTMPLPTAWPVLKGNWIPSSRLYLDLRTLPSPHPLKMPPLPLARTHPSWDWGLAEPRWIQSWMARPWMKEKYPVTTETWRTWTCLMKRLTLPQQGVSGYRVL